MQCEVQAAGWEEETGPVVVGGGLGMFNDGGQVRGGREKKEEGREGVGMISAHKVAAPAWFLGLNSKASGIHAKFSSFVLVGDLEECWHL